MSNRGVSQAEERVSELLHRAVAAGRSPGAVAAWEFGASEAKIVTSGRSAIPGGEALDERSVFDLASLTKPLLTTTLVLLAARHFDLSLDLTLGEWTPSLVSSSWLAQLSVEDLLRHRSGLPAWKPLYAIMRPGESLVRVLDRLGPEYEINSRSLYSCLGFILLGAVIEELFGERLDQVFRKLVLDPLDLGNDLYIHPKSEHLVAGPAWPGPEWKMTRDLGLDPHTLPPGNQPEDGNARFLGGVAGNSGLFGTARGVLRLASEYLPGGGQLLRAEEVEIVTRRSRNDSTADRRLGWQGAAEAGSSAGPALSFSAFGHTGFSGTSVWVDSTIPCVIALLTNRNHPAFRAVNLHPLRRRYHQILGS